MGGQLPDLCWLDDLTSSATGLTATAIDSSAGHPAQDPRQLRIGEPCDQHTGPVVVEHRAGPLSPPSPDLGEILEAGHERDPLSAAGGCHDVEVCDRSDRGRLVQDDE